MSIAQRQFPEPHTTPTFTTRSLFSDTRSVIGCQWITNMRTTCDGGGAAIIQFKETYDYCRTKCDTTANCFAVQTVDNLTCHFEYCQSTGISCWLYLDVTGAPDPIPSCRLVPKVSNSSLSNYIPWTCEDMHCKRKTIQSTCSVMYFFSGCMIWKKWKWKCYE